ncbi:sugar phosphate isomerase/epimerase family protein [Haliovirga abyssi]|uniref:AP endonuclease n=1 Tax=Haliovirga abyssi TaxID=2996794 RepID=A0AAU9DVL5_9FUSO|nr:sugar phosphate isomerase/epimerase family protein [Haliovirga abyssi]BDU50251.1 AP endonuclease [Haliovirga abyssi]
MKLYIKQDIKNIEKNIEFFIKNKVGIEISLYDVEFINNMRLSKILKLSKLLKENNLKITSHLPIHGLDLGCRDSIIREYSSDLIIKSLDLSSVLGVKKSVLHSGMNPLRKGQGQEKWLKRFELELTKIEKVAREMNIELVIENVWDDNDIIYKFIVEKFSNINLCFDIGHSAVYQKNIKIEELFKKYGNRITHLHLHDNDLLEDKHFHFGEGKIEFENYFQIFKKYLKEYTVTLETNFDEKLYKDMEFVRKGLLK